MNTNELYRPASWRETLLALVPFLLFPFLFLLATLITPLIKAPVDPIFGLGISLAIIGIFLILIIVGWVKNFPRWVFPYWGFILLITLYAYNFTGTMAGYQVRGDWWAWIPLASVALIGSFGARGLQPIRVLLKSIWKDWTLLSFTLYGALPLIFIFAYDEVYNKGPVLAVIMLILTAGTIFYMRTENIWGRFTALGGGFSLGWVILMIHQAIYWNGRQEPWMPKPGSWIKTLSWTSRFGASLMLILVAPVLIEILRRVVKSRRTPKTTS